MTDTVKKIVSEYTKIPVTELQPETGIGRKAVGNSIILHRMYAAIAKEGIEVTGYQDIKTFGELTQKISGDSATINAGDQHRNNHVPVTHEFRSPGIGIDIEEISEMPRANDFRDHQFYTMNFTPEEIAYCVLQPDQYASFAGLFAVKEALVKADNIYIGSDFNTIFIDHLPGGKPIVKGFNISISHSQNVAIAVAIKNAENINGLLREEVLIKKNNSSVIVSVIAVILALIAIFISLVKYF